MQRNHKKYLFLVIKFQFKKSPFFPVIYVFFLNFCRQVLFKVHPYIVPGLICYAFFGFGHLVIFYLEEMDFKNIIKFEKNYKITKCLCLQQCLVYQRQRCLQGSMIVSQLLHTVLTWYQRESAKVYIAEAKMSTGEYDCVPTIAHSTYLVSKRICTGIAEAKMSTGEYDCAPTITHSTYLVSKRISTGIYSRCKDV